MTHFLTQIVAPYDGVELEASTYKVPERAYTAWPEHIRTAFTAARTVRTGKATFKLTLTGAEVRRHIGTDAAHVFGGLLATLTSWAELNRIPYEGVPVGTIKRFATGKGNADKAAVIAAMEARGFRPADDNEADALALLLWATSSTGGRA